MPGLTLASFIFFAFQLTRIATLSAQGLSDTAAPSLVLLGTAKGGTTDVWHMIHRIHKGFCSFDPQTFESFDSQYPEHIQTKKELDFFGDGLDSVCSGVNGAGYKKLFCTPDEMGSLLRCPNVLVNQWVEERKKRPNSANLIAARCKEWLTVHHIKLSRYTATASPSLMYSFLAASRALGAAPRAARSTDSPLFVMLLRHPAQRIVSLYNHWFVQEQNSGNGYSLTLEALVELELSLLRQKTPQKHLAIIKECVDGKRNIRRVQRALGELRSYMEVELARVSASAVGRVNLRSFGLVLDGFYSLQLLGWLSLAKPQPRSGKGASAFSSTPLDIRNKLLIVKSEDMFADRERFMYDVLLPFLHPLSANHSSQIQWGTRGSDVGGGGGHGNEAAGNGVDNAKEITSLYEENSMIITRETGKSPSQQVQNQKKYKHPSSRLSLETASTLMKFYDTINVNAILFGLQTSGKARVIPELTGESDSWWDHELST